MLSEIEREQIFKFLGSGIAEYFSPKLCFIFSNRNAHDTDARKLELSKVRRIISFVRCLNHSYDLVKIIHMDSAAETGRKKYLHEHPNLPFCSKPVPRQIINICDDPGKFCVQAATCPRRRPAPSSSRRETTQCMGAIGRYPILYSNYFDTHIYFLEK